MQEQTACKMRWHIRDIPASVASTILHFGGRHAFCSCTFFIPVPAFILRNYGISLGFYH
jgi:hypothetical protein